MASPIPPANTTSLIQKLAVAYMKRERARLGIVKDEQDADENSRRNLLVRAQAAKIGQEMGFAPADQDLKTRLTEAQIRNLDEANHVPPQTSAHYTTDKDGNVTAIERQPDGSYRQVPIGPVGTPQREPRPPAELGRLSPVVDKDGRIIGTFHNVTGEFKPVAGTTPGRPVQIGGAEARKSPIPAAMQQTEGIAATVKDNLAKMKDLASSVTTGPIEGRLSQASQSIMGPHGDEGTFDFLGKAVVDTVYIKSGKQINENEMSILKGMIPTRARGNLPEQVRLFTEYANGLLRQYGVQDEAATPAASGHAGPCPPGQRMQRNTRTGATRCL